MARPPSGPGIHRDRTVLGQRTGAVLQDFHECTDGDPEELEVWCRTDRVTYAPGGRVCLHASISTPHCDLETVCHGATPETVYRVEGLAGAMHQMPEDCSVNDCDWRSGGYVVLTSVRRSDERFEHRRQFIVRPVVPVCAIGSRTGRNEWVGSSHDEDMTGPDKDEFSIRPSKHRPWSRGFACQPKGVPRIARNVLDRFPTAGVDCG